MRRRYLNPLPLYRRWLLVALVSVSIFVYCWHIDRDPQSPATVAFLFLTRESLPLEPLWDAFFETAPATKPFTIYVHARPGIEFNSTITRSPHFRNRHVSNSVKVGWGQSSMIEAERLLLQTALKNPSNQRFVLLSDSCIFLHSYATVYDYVTSSPKSFVDSFREGEDAMRLRYNPKMGPTLPPELWRKGSQWFALTRPHAEAVVSDQTLLPLFQQLCKAIAKVEYTSEWRTEWCYADGKPNTCFLFARKFTQDAGIKILKYMDKDVGLRL